MRSGNRQVAYGNAPATVPELVGTGGCAWPITPARPEAPGGFWLIKDARNGWYYLVSTTALEPDECSHTHDISCFALDPREALPDTEGWEGGEVLSAEFCRHFTVRSDMQAQQVLRMVVQAICDGDVPHSRARYWAGVIDATAEHFYFGTHPSFN